MANILDYLIWRGDIPFSSKPFNEVDAVILARISYMRLDRFMYFAGLEPVPLHSAVKKLLEPAVSGAVKPLSENNTKMLNAILDSERYSGVEMLYYMSHFDAKSEAQFAAVTFRIGKSSYYVAFRGTDNTLVGWKEDLNMSFACPVPAQGEAVRYLDSLGRKLGVLPALAKDSGKLPAVWDGNARFIVGGHSKGGNLAVYSSAFCDEALQKKIDLVYNFDGPGFNPSVLGSGGYKRICERIRTFVPQSSIVGMLLEHEEKYTIVRSTNNNIWQHDTYSWEVERSGFREIESVTNGSRFLDYTFKAWMTSLDPARRERFVDAVYRVLLDTNATTLKELTQNKFDTLRKVFSSIRKLPEQTRRDLTHTVRLFAKSAKVGYLRMLQERAENEQKLLKS